MAKKLKVDLNVSLCIFQNFLCIFGIQFSNSKRQRKTLKVLIVHYFSLNNDIFLGQCVYLLLKNRESLIYIICLTLSMLQYTIYASAFKNKCSKFELIKKCIIPEGGKKRKAHILAYSFSKFGICVQYLCLITGLLGGHTYLYLLVFNEK